MQCEVVYLFVFIYNEIKMLFLDDVEDVENIGKVRFEHE